MKTIKRMLIMTLCLCVVSCSAFVGVTTAQAEMADIFIAGKYPDEMYDSIYEGLFNGNLSIDISEYGLDIDDVVWVYTAVINSHPNLFYVGGQIGYSYIGDYAAELIPTYKYTGQTLDVMREEYEAMMEIIVARFENLSDIEAVVAVNDYIATHYKYDSSGLDSATEIRDVYNMLKQGTAVCQGYALLFLDIMSRLGIECTCAVSNDMNHQWNIVKLGSDWYHIDVTWDDPIGIDDGYSYHDYMLLSDTEMIARGHYNWDRVDNCDDPCVNDKFDLWSWNESNVQLTPHNNRWYYVYNTEDGINITEVSEDGSRIVYTHSGYWHVWNNPGYIYARSISTSTWYKNWMLYHTEDKLYCYDTVLGEQFYLCELDTSDGYVYYIHSDDDMLKYIASSSPNDLENGVSHQLDISGVHYSGDVDGSGVINSVDFICASQVVLGLSGTNSLAYTDVDNTPEFNSADLLLMQQIMLGTSQPTVRFN